MARYRLASVLMVVTVFGTVSCLKPKSSDSQLDYSQSAELVYTEAMDDFDDQDCIAAEPKFQDVRRKFPYSRYAVLAELHIADCQFMQENFAEAAVLFEQFSKAHPTHEDAHYAAYKRGLSYYEMIPSDVFILPPSHERDQSATRDARMVLQTFLKNYPESPWREKALQILSEVVDALVRHEIYVAEFYLSREDRLAAVVRLENVRANFEESTLVPDAMFLQATTYLEMNKRNEARQVFEEIIQYYPDHHQSLRAKAYIDHMDARVERERRGGDG